MSTKQQSDLATALQSPTQYSKPQNEVQETKMEESLYDPLGNSPKSGSKTVHIRPISLKKESGYYSEIRSKLRRLQMPLWNSSATTWTRDASPSHRVPKAYRQTIGDINLRRTTRWILKLDTTRNISNPEKGMGFAKSTRIQHFFDKNRTSEPSAQSYHQHRYMDNSHYKMPQLSQTKQPGQTQMLKTLQSCILDSIVSDKNRNAEQKTEVSLTKVMDSYLNTPTIEQPRRFDELKGRTFGKQEKPTHRYYDHAHRFAYNESFTIDYPGAGSYNTSLQFAKRKYLVVALTLIGLKNLRALVNIIQMRCVLEQHQLEAPSKIAIDWIQLSPQIRHLAQHSIIRLSRPSKRNADQEMFGAVMRLIEALSNDVGQFPFNKQYESIRS